MSLQAENLIESRHDEDYGWKLRKTSAYESFTIYVWQHQDSWCYLYELECGTLRSSKTGYFFSVDDAIQEGIAEVIRLKKKLAQAIE